MKRKLLSVISAAALFISLLPLNTFATEPPAYTDVSGHWAEAAIETWSTKGIIQGSDGAFRPDAPITRGELAVIVDRMMKYQTAARNTFSDLGQAFYTEAMLKANHAGIIKGDGETMRPMANITREEAVTVLGRALGLTESITGTSFDDGAAISVWAAGYVNTAVSRGIIQGHENKFAPKESITRAQVVTILNNAISAIYSTPGTYTDSATGTVIVNSPNVTLKDITIGGDLIIAEGVGTGDVYLDNVKVEGKTIVRGGGENSIHILGNSQLAVVIIDRQDGKVRISVEGGADVQIVIVDDGSDDVKIDGAIGTLNIEGSGASVEVTGTVSEINVAGPNTILRVSGTVTTVAIEATAANTKVNTTSTAQITTVQAGAAGTQVTGDGKVAAVEATANNVAVSTPNTKVEAAQGTTGVTAGDKPVTGGSSATTPPSTPPASGGGGGGGSGTTPEQALQGYSVKAGDTTLTDVDAAAFLRAVAASDSSRLTYAGGIVTFVGSPTTDAYGRTSGLSLTTTAPAKARMAESYVSITNGTTTYYVVFSAEPAAGADGRTSKYLCAILAPADGYTDAAELAGITAYKFDFFFGQDKALLGYAVKAGDTTLDSVDALAFLNAVATWDTSTLAYASGGFTFDGSPITDAYGRTSGLSLTTTAPAKVRTAESYVSITNGTTTYYVVFSAEPAAGADGRTSKYLCAIPAPADGYTDAEELAGITAYKFDFFFGQNPT